jgi:hypothetical protein
VLQDKRKTHTQQYILLYAGNLSKQHTCHKKTGVWHVFNQKKTNKREIVQHAAKDYITKDYIYKEKYEREAKEEEDNEKMESYRVECDFKKLERVRADGVSIDCS